MVDELVLRPPLSEEFRNQDAFDWVFSLTGEIFRDLGDHKTIRFKYAGASYFAKIHYGVGWTEIIKNLISGRLPIISAKTEWEAVSRIESLGIETVSVVAYGCRGWDPSSRESFIITKDLGSTVSLETLCSEWIRHPPAPRYKWELLRRVAEIAGKLHRNGVNHRDLYLCHFLVPISDNSDLLSRPTGPMYLIDLHRAQIRKNTPFRWQVKDIAGLYFSSMDAGLTMRDCLRFLRAYTGQPLRDFLYQDQRFLTHVRRRARNLYRSFHGREALPKY